MSARSTKQPTRPPRAPVTAMVAGESVADRHEAFAQEYLLDLNPGAAYKRVYGRDLANDVACAAGWRLLRESDVANRVAELKAARNARMGLEHDRVLRQLMDIVECDPGRIFDEQGNLRHPAQMDDRTRNALKSLKVRRVRSLDGITEDVVAVEFWDKAAATRTAMQHMGLLGETASIPAQQTPLGGEPWSDEDMRRRLKEIAAILGGAQLRAAGARYLGFTKDSPPPLDSTLMAAARKWFEEGKREQVVRRVG